MKHPMTMARLLVIMAASAAPVAAPARAQSEARSEVRSEAPEQGPTAVIEDHLPASVPLDDLVMLKRHGETVEIRDPLELAPGTEIHIRRPEAVVKVRVLLTNELRLLTREPGQDVDDPVFTAPESDIPGLTGNLLAWYRSIVGASSTPTTVIAATRGLGGSCFNRSGLTNDPIRFDIPALYADHPAMAAGTRPWSLAWRGGAAPFTVTLSNSATGSIVAQIANIVDDCAARTAPVAIPPGRYTVALQDGNGARLVEPDLAVEPTAPAMPPELADAALPARARQLYFATTLTVVEQGRWTFEALQQVGALDCHDGAVRAWLQRWGGTRSDCGS